MTPEAARRLMHSEVRILDPGTAFATVTSPIGTQTSKRLRLLGQAEALEVAKGDDPLPRPIGGGSVFDLA